MLLPVHPLLYTFRLQLAIDAVRCDSLPSLSRGDNEALCCGQDGGSASPTSRSFRVAHCGVVLCLGRQRAQERQTSRCRWFFILHSKIKPAAPARPGINSSTKEQCIFKARPAKRHVYFKPCKKLLDVVEESVEEDSWDAPMGASTTESDTNN